jgi:tRNA(Ile)-lysidine synthase
MEAIFSSVWSDIKHQQLLKPRTPCVIGVSGGPDSVALLLILHRINQKYKQNWSLHIAHLNHGLRGPAADRDEQFVKSLARRLKLPFYKEKKSLKRLIAQNPSWENTAREARYRFLVKIARQVKAPVIAVGHTLDDQSETVLMHLIRGCGFRGLSGILPKREVLPDTAIKLIRPLLNLTRPELLRFLKS